MKVFESWLAAGLLSKAGGLCESSCTGVSCKMFLLSDIMVRSPSIPVLNRLAGRSERCTPILRRTAELV
jgi:hypothetical protein